MKSIFRKGASLAIIGGTLLSSLVIGTLEVLALTQEQILQKLAPVLVYTISNQKGETLIREIRNEQRNSTAKVAGIFISQKDAQAFLEKIKSENPQLANTMQVIPQSLADVYQLEEENKKKPEALNFAYVPTQQQVDSALTVLRQTGKNVNEFNGVPLFVISGGPNKGFLPAQRGEQQIIPFFFSKEEVQAEVDRIKKTQPDLASTLQIDVIPLEGLLDAWKNRKEEWLSKIELIPSQESRELLRTLLTEMERNNPNRPASGNPAAPAQNPRQNNQPRR
jgi:nickel transport protein